MSRTKFTCSKQYNNYIYTDMHAFMYIYIDTYMVSKLQEQLKFSIQSKNDWNETYPNTGRSSVRTFTAHVCTFTHPRAQQSKRFHLQSDGCWRLVRRAKTTLPRYYFLHRRLYRGALCEGESLVLLFTGCARCFTGARQLQEFARLERHRV